MSRKPPFYELAMSYTVEDTKVSTFFSVCRIVNVALYERARGSDVL